MFNICRSNKTRFKYEIYFLISWSDYGKYHFEATELDYNYNIHRLKCFHSPDEKL